MDNLARAISGAALLLAGVALVIFDRFGGRLGLLILIFGLLLMACGFYISCRVGGIKVYASQTEVGEMHVDR